MLPLDITIGQVRVVSGHEEAAVSQLLLQGERVATIPQIDDA